MAEKTITADERRDALVEKIFADSIAFMEILGVYLGDKLGLYAAMSDGAWMSAPELASRAKVNERYAREWLEFQAVSGVLDAECDSVEDDSVEDDSAEPFGRRYRIPEGHDEVLLDRDSLAYVTPLAKQMVGLARPLPALIEAMKSGGGVSFPEYGEDIREGIEFGNRAMFVNLMGEWISAVPDLHERLSSSHSPARVADIGCGSGWSSISIAKAYPNARVDGLDLDGDSIEAARRNAASEGLEDRLSFQLRDASAPELSGTYDFAIAIECIHDMSRPVEALRAMRSLVGESGTVVVVDERVGDEFVAPGEDVDRLYYGFSVLHCLPVGMSEKPSAETGTVMRTDTLGGYAREAGFSEVEVLPVENDMWRFYRLR
ncbi:MAG: class I SAM-dependent methyltransferase [Actinomycetota bacterium]|jgi:2-polyprenyl-3-methyl-5-hydroxy-6-metoxy-1,4-benzoquinol methylase|nr:class I SAM-dependent methyltransferase [Rubrobacter sp.]MDQ3509523.1 class I SAM-dependent methyltransferase [Actinomycetota bacterium]